MEHEMDNLASKTWWAAAGTRCIKTAAQAAIGAIGASATLVSDVDWRVVALTAGLAAIVSLLTSLEGLPELTSGTETATAAIAETVSAPVATTVAEPVTETAPVAITADAATAAATTPDIPAADGDGKGV